MTTHSQRQVFLEGEGDAWFKRNHLKSDNQISEWTMRDPLESLVEKLPLPDGPKVSVDEIGCGQGLRLRRLRDKKGWCVAGLDPSEKAIATLKEAGIKEFRGSGDELPISDQSVDILNYGFCLYLCDRNYLFKITAEAQRVLKPKTWPAIIDFCSSEHLANTYHHRTGINSYKDDLTKVVNWHPSYVTDQ